jgi:phosphotransacetylase
MDVIKQIREKAKARHKRVVLPEGTEERMVKAARDILAGKIAEVVLLGDEEKIEKLAESSGLDLSQVKVVNPANAERYGEYAGEYSRLREKKGMTLEQAK